MGRAKRAKTHSIRENVRAAPDAHLLDLNGLASTTVASPVTRKPIVTSCAPSENATVYSPGRGGGGGGGASQP
eukprot:4871623-Prymnesium_polylepis.2